MDLKAYLEEKGRLVDRALEEVLPRSAGFEKDLVESMRYSLFVGGKRLRPVLCLAGAEAVGAAAKAALPAAAALEMIHAYSLIHDDLPAMDDDDLRRGRPSNHKVFGEGPAILAGDGLLTLAFAHLARAGVNGDADPDRTLAALDVIAHAAGPYGMVGGQAVDLASEGGDVDIQTVEYIHQHKTAALMAAAVASGAILGGGSAAQVDALNRYGQKIGLAFQIIDDILDIEGDQERLGKPIGSDQARGKATWPALAGLAAARERAGTLVDEALTILKPFGSGADSLREIARYLLTRKS